MNLTRALGTAVAVLALTAGCAAGDDVTTSATATTSAAATDAVTDRAAFGLSEEERKDLENQCKKADGVPGTSEGCDGSSFRRLPPCTPRDDWCLQITVTGDAGTLRVVAQDSGESCAGDADQELCDGVEIPREVAASVVADARSDPDDGSDGGGEPTEEASPTP